MNSLDAIKNQIADLAAEDREDLASFIMDSLEAPAYSVSDEEVHRRAAELGSGTVKGISHNELMQKLGRA